MRSGPMKLAFLTACSAMASGTAPGQQPTNEVRKALEWKRFEYVCEGNAKVTVYLREQTAKVLYAERQYLMKQTISADGNRYSDGKVVWWGKGNGGFLEEDKLDGNGEMLVNDCKLVEPENRDPGVLTGTVTYRERMALPRNAVLQVQLREMPIADAREPAAIIAEQKITTDDKQVPVPFELKFDPAKIHPERSYRVNARILVGGEVRFFNDHGPLVLTQGNPSHAEFVLNAVEAKK